MHATERNELLLPLLSLQLLLLEENKLQMQILNPSGLHGTRWRDGSISVASVFAKGGQLVCSSRELMLLCIKAMNLGLLFFIVVLLCIISVLMVLAFEKLILVHNEVRHEYFIYGKVNIRK